MRIFGIDGGIASVGWAVLDVTDQTGQVVKAGTWMFDSPETPKERTPTNAIRRQKRGQRRVTRRRHQRMAAIRTLLAAHGLIEHNITDALALSLDPWALRAEALNRKLTNAEFAAILGHIAKHRGFRSNAKAEAGANTASETSKMKLAIEATRDKLGQWRSIGEMFALDPAFADRKRNRGGGFTRSILRSDQEHEIRAVFRAQSQMGNQTASPELQNSFTDIAFSQRPLQDSHHLVGKCPFIPTEQRAARRAPSFELFRLFSRLAALRIAVHGPRGAAIGDRPLSPSEISQATEDFGKQKQLTYDWLRRRIALEDSADFVGIPRADEKKRDFVARTGAAAEGTYALRQTLTDADWRALNATPPLLDEIAAILTFRSDLGSIRQGLIGLDIAPHIATTLADAADAGKFNAFAGAGHISAAAARCILPHLATGLGYAEACMEAGYNHAEQAEVKLDDIKNPVARKAIGELLKQVRAMVQQFGLPELIHIELARDVGKSAEERYEITAGIEKRNRERDKLRARFEEDIGRPPNRSDEMLRYELWHEQGFRCLYTDTAILPNQLVAGDNSVQVDHILPWSRFGDDSFVNKTLCLAGANAQKKDRTPYEWFSPEKSADDLAAFERRVQSCLGMKRYKKHGHYLRRNAAEVEERFRARNLGDTRYATHVALGLLARLYPQDGQVHVRARPGALTAKLRRGWGLEALKKTAEGERRPDDRHHALDAIVVAACSQSTLNNLTRAFQQSERAGRARDFAKLDPPWPGFREEVETIFSKIFVARAERHRARGEAHAATIRQVRERDGKLVVFERRAIEDLNLKDLQRIKDADRNKAILQSIAVWIKAGKPKDALPTSPKGDIIRKVRLESKDKPAVAIRGGTAARGDMARVDVFRKDDAKGRARFYLLPIYPHEVATLEKPPTKAIDQGKDEFEWTKVDQTFSFLFSLYGHSYVQIIKSNGEICAGYFKGVDRATGAISLAAHSNLDAQQRGIGARTLLTFQKYQIDRLGRRFEIRQETRTWHGVACT